MAPQQHIGQLSSAHQQVGQVGVAAVVDQRGAVQPGRVQAGGQHHTGRRCRIPLPLPTGVDVGVDVAADHGHRLGARRSDPDQLDVERSRIHHSTAGGRLALAVIRIGPSVRGGGGVTVSVRYTSPRAGSATAASVMRRRWDRRRAARARCAPPSRRARAWRTPGCRPPGRRSRPGRRVPGTGRRPLPRTSTASSGRSALQPVEDQRVGPPVAGIAEVVGIVEADLLAHRQQQFTGIFGHLGGQRRIGHTHRPSRSRPRQQPSCRHRLR